MNVGPVVLVSAALLLGGCSKPEYQTVTIVSVHTRAQYISEPAWTQAYPFTTVKSEDGRLFVLVGERGAVVDTFRMNLNGSAHEVGN